MTGDPMIRPPEKSERTRAMLAECVLYGVVSAYLRGAGGNRTRD